MSKLLEKAENWSFKLYMGVAWRNIDEVGSTRGEIVVITDGVRQYSACWLSNRLNRVCNSGQQVELIGLMKKMKDFGYVRTVGFRLETTVYINKESTMQDKKV